MGQAHNQHTPHNQPKAALVNFLKKTDISDTASCCTCRGAGYGTSPQPEAFTQAAGDCTSCDFDWRQSASTKPPAAHVDRRVWDKPTTNKLHNQQGAARVNSNTNQHHRHSHLLRMWRMLGMGRAHTRIPSHKHQEIAQVIRYLC